MTDLFELKVRVKGEHFPSANALATVGSAAGRVARMFVGVQRGEEIEQLVDVSGGSAQFDVSFSAKQAPNGAPNFTGPYAKGTPTERFFYFVWIKVDANGGHERCGRTKVPLMDLTWPAVEKAARAGKAIGVTLTMSDAKGRPRLGSLKPGEMRWSV